MIHVFFRFVNRRFGIKRCAKHKKRSKHTTCVTVVYHSLWQSSVGFLPLRCSSNRHGGVRRARLSQQASCSRAMCFSRSGSGERLFVTLRLQTNICNQGLCATCGLQIDAPASAAAAPETHGSFHQRSWIHGSRSKT